MYMPPQFASDDRLIAADLIRQHPFASLISVAEDGQPYVTHLPLHLQADEGQWVLLGHVARPNPHWRYLQSRPQALVTVLGPHAYMSPKVYPDLVRVPTWNYLAVHCTVHATLIDGHDDKDTLLKCLIGDHEPAYAEQWRGLGEDYANKMLAGIQAFRLDVTSIQCKLKLNQHRKEAHAAMREAYRQGSPTEQALGRWMDRLGMS